MQRRTFLSLLALPAVAQFLQACGDDAGKGGSPTVPGRSTLRGNAPRAKAGDDDAIQASAAINAFAQDLYEQLVAADPTANLVFSPASISIALTMAAVGARGTTVDEMNAVLHIDDDGAIDRSMNGLMTVLESVNRTRDNTADGGEGTSEVQLDVANSLWVQSGLSFEQAFMEILSGEYDAGVELVDYAADPEAARLAINDWVAQHTEQRIPQLLAQGAITTDSRLTLVNAIYLKANWDTVFPKDATEIEPFAAPLGEVSAQMMHRTAEFGYAAGNGWQAIDIPYVFRELAMTVVVGDADDTVLPTGDELFAMFTGRRIELGLPRFDIETSTDLVSVLGELGMVTPFTGAADFSGITQAEALAIGGVIHQANITVDEEGTEAAAATAVIMVATGAPAEDEPIVLTIDRPFTFWLREVTTGTIVFMGRVNDPSATR